MGNGVEAFPLAWPEGWKRARRREQSRFRTEFTKARDFLFAEIGRMGGSRTVLSTNLPLRRDGLPYANQPNPQDSGVAVYFRYHEKSMVFACDRFTKVGDNIYAIGLTIEALRGIERWGASDMMERAFSGFKALSSETKKSWSEVLNLTGHSATREQIEAQYRILARTRHPDAGGSNQEMAELNQARIDALREIGA